MYVAISREATARAAVVHWIGAEVGMMTHPSLYHRAKKLPRGSRPRGSDRAPVLGVRGPECQRIDAVVSTAAVRVAEGSSESSTAVPAARSIVFTIDCSSPSTTCVTRTS